MLSRRQFCGVVAAAVGTAVLPWREPEVGVVEAGPYLYTNARVSSILDRAAAQCALDIEGLVIFDGDTVTIDSLTFTLPRS